MNLTVIENKVIANMPVSLQEFVTAKFRPQIQSIREPELALKVSALVMRTLTEAGVKDAGDNKVVTFLRETLLKDLQNPKFSKLTFEEIELALKKGVRHEYGPFMGVNVQTIHFWIKSFLGSKEREAAIKEFYKNADEQEYGKIDRSTPVNPEGQKRILEALRPFAEYAKPTYKTTSYTPPKKSERDVFIQECFKEFDKLCDKSPSIDRFGNKIPGRLIDHEITDLVGYNEKNKPILKTHVRPIDVTEYTRIKVTEYDKKQNNKI